MQQQQQSALAERDTLLHRKPAAATSTTTTTTTISDGIEHDARPDKRSDEWTGKSGKGFIVDNVRRRFSSRGQSGARVDPSGGTSRARYSANGIDD